MIRGVYDGFRRGPARCFSDVLDLRAGRRETARRENRRRVAKKEKMREKNTRSERDANEKRRIICKDGGLRWETYSQVVQRQVCYTRGEEKIKREREEDGKCSVEIEKEKKRRK